MNTRRWNGWMPWAGAILALMGALTYLLLSTPLVIGMALAAGDPRRIGLILVLGGLLLSLVGLWLASRPSAAQRRRRAIVLFLVALSLSGSYVIGAFLTFPYHIEAVRFDNGAVELAGTLVLPRGDGPHPAVIFMHGAGPELGGQSFYLADQFARRGVAALLYDKRGSGASRGGQPYDSYRDLAEDALAGVHFLQQRLEINPGHIGLGGMSEGGWTAPLAASLSNDVAFLMVVSGAGASVEMENYYFIEHHLRGKGFGEEEVGQAVALRRQINGYYRTGEGRDQVIAAIQEAEGHPWLVEAQILPTSSQDIYLFASPSATEYLAFIDFDATPLLENVEVPMLFVYGEEDRSHPVADSIRIIEERLAAPGDKDVTIVVFPRADHSMLVWSGPVPRLAPGYVDTLIAWLLERVQVADPS